MVEEKRVGRKGLYREWLKPENLVRLQGWARDGLSDKQIAANMGITSTTYYEWKNKFPAFAEALKYGKEAIDREVENALLKSAMGYEYQEQIVTKDGIQTVTKVQHPNQTAQIFWLKNRKPQIWRDRKDIDVQTSVIDMTADERQQRINELKSKLQLEDNIQ